jgi:hypothetical protein
MMLPPGIRGVLLGLWDGACQISLSDLALWFCRHILFADHFDDTQPCIYICHHPTLYTSRRRTCNNWRASCWGGKVWAGRGSGEGKREEKVGTIMQFMCLDTILKHTLMAF